MDYPKPTFGQLYILYDISEETVEPELLHRPWYIESFVKEKTALYKLLYTNLFGNSGYL